MCIINTVSKSTPESHLNKLDKDHKPQILSIILSRRGRQQRQKRSNHTRQPQPMHLPIGIIHNISRRRLKQELTHPKHEEEDARLLFAVVLGDDEEGRLHVDHCKAVAEFAEEEGYEAEEEAGVGFGFFCRCFRHGCSGMNIMRYYVTVEFGLALDGQRRLEFESCRADGAG